MKTRPKRLKLSPSRTVAIPPAIKKALANAPAAKALFDNLSYSHKKEYVDWISSAKQEETVNRRLAKMIPRLLAKATLKG